LKEQLLQVLTSNVGISWEEETGLDENTLVIFTSDNGSWLILKTKMKLKEVRSKHLEIDYQIIN
jgi:hypothetical protein